MFGLKLSPPGTALNLLCLGAHADDIEIGCGGTILRLVGEFPFIHVRWVVFSGQGERQAEADASAARFLKGSAQSRIEVHSFRDGYFPHEGALIKDRFEALKEDFHPAMILTHWGGDAHQDHRVVAELTHNTFRDHLIFEYEIPKYDGDLGNPQVFAPLTREVFRRKLSLVGEGFPSQKGKRWFSEETFSAIARLRGLGCNAPEGVAEAFYVRKLVI